MWTPREPCGRAPLAAHGSVRDLVVSTRQDPAWEPDDTTPWPAGGPLSDPYGIEPRAERVVPPSEGNEVRRDELARSRSTQYDR